MRVVLGLYLDLYRLDCVVGIVNESTTEGAELGIVGRLVLGPFEIMNVGEHRTEHPASYGDVRMAWTQLAISKATLAGLQHRVKDRGGWTEQAVVQRKRIAPVSHTVHAHINSCHNRSF